MTTRLLILGGSGFVGRAVTDEAAARGWEVTTFNRGQRRPADIVGDRGVPATLAPLTQRDWDVVLDTWSGAPRAVRDSATALAERTGRYVYISSGSVYPPPMALGLSEDAPTAAGDRHAEAADYPANKRGAELAVLAAVGEDRALIARAGSILGPYDDVGRLPWWLRRMSQGGDVRAPGPRDNPQQFIDVRDLARFVLDDHAGTFNMVNRRGHTTMEGLLEACRRVAGAPGTRLVWQTPEEIAAAGLEPWEDLPLWIPPGHEYEGLLGMDVERAHAAGLRCRPAEETVADTWAWLAACGAQTSRPG
jgi:nucleoside-diphosphate-sugar epimerase